MRPATGATTVTAPSPVGSRATPGPTRPCAKTGSGTSDNGIRVPSRGDAIAVISADPQCPRPECRPRGQQRPERTYPAGQRRRHQQP
ncbi:hypothetical protein G6F45_014222 [Rhizopus arrhizus]|nr:hypothetical protein G6F45_014222 [Rhizopus arrhizus]